MTPRPPAIQWSDKLATGVEEIDSQHRYLINAINNAREALIERRDLERIGPLTKDLLAYAIFHFDTEEDLMREYGYDREAGADAAAHHQEHRDFSARVIAIRDALNEGLPVAAEDLVGFLENWLIGHIMQTDQKFGAFVRGKRGV